MLSIVHLLRYKNNDRLHFIMTKCLEYQFKYLTRQLLTKINKFWALIKPSMFTPCYRKTACWRTVCCWPRWGPMSIGDQSNNHHGLSVFNHILQKNQFTIPSWASVFICWSSKFKTSRRIFLVSWPRAGGADLGSLTLVENLTALPTWDQYYKTDFAVTQLTYHYG